MRSTVFSRKCCKTAEITDFRLPELSFPAVFLFLSEVVAWKSQTGGHRSPFSSWTLKNGYYFAIFREVRMAKNPDAKTGYKRPPADHEILLDDGYRRSRLYGEYAAGSNRRFRLWYADICGYINLPHGVQWGALYGNLQIQCSGKADEDGTPLQYR